MAQRCASPSFVLGKKLFNVAMHLARHDRPLFHVTGGEGRGGGVAKCCNSATVRLVATTPPYLFLMIYQERQMSHCGRSRFGRWQWWRSQGRRTATVEGGSGRRLWSGMRQGAPTVSGFYCGQRQWRWRRQRRTATVDSGSRWGLWSGMRQGAPTVSGFYCE